MCTYDGWEKAGEVSEGALAATGETVTAGDADTTVVVVGLPHASSTRSLTEPPWAKSVTFTWGHAIESWLRMRHSIDVSVRVGPTAEVTEMPDEVRADRTVGHGEVRIRLRYVGGESEPVGRPASVRHPASVGRSIGNRGPGAVPDRTRRARR